MNTVTVLVCVSGWEFTPDDGSGGIGVVDVIMDVTVVETDNGGSFSCGWGGRECVVLTLFRIQKLLRKLSSQTEKPPLVPRDDVFP